MFTIHGSGKTRDTGLPDGEDRIPLQSLGLTHYQSMTDGHTDGYAVAYTALKVLYMLQHIHPVVCQTEGLQRDAVFTVG